jgi:myosin heavy subunit
MEQRRKTIEYAGAVIIALMLIGLIITIGFNAKARKNLNVQKLASERLLSEKLSLDKKLLMLSDDYNKLKGESDRTSELLAAADIKRAENEKKINSLNAENRSLRAVKKELAELQKAKSDLEKQTAQLKSDYERQVAQSRDLQNSLKLLEDEKKNLASQLENALRVRTDNFLVKATRGKKTENIVARASRTKNINVTFEVPAGLTEDISFTIVTPSGTTIHPDDKAISWYFPEVARNFTASLSSLTGEFEQSRQVVLKYASQTKLIRGEYKIQILCEGSNIGNCRILLK